jgi:NADH dehydrogenase
MQSKHHVVIIGGGFGGLYAALNLKDKSVDVTLIDRRNFHLFQPLLYQVATGGLSPANIASPLRHALRRRRNVTVVLGEVVDIDVANCKVILADGEIGYDSLVVATGSGHHYFGNAHWERLAPSLKTLEDATEIRGRVLKAFEAAEREHDPFRIRALLTFVIVGAGPTGVELAGALQEISVDTMKRDFRRIRTEAARIIIVEGLDRVLPGYPEKLSLDAERALKRFGVEVRIGTKVIDIKQGEVHLESGETSEILYAHTVLWAAGVQASPLGKSLAVAAGLQLDKLGRVPVNPDLSIPGLDNVYVIGDLARCDDNKGKPLPGLAPVAMQQGRYVSKLICARLKGKGSRRFHYRNFGTMATIGRAAAVVNNRWLKFSGYFAWLFWLFVHLMYIVEYENRLLVLMQWAWNYFTRNRSARLITGKIADPAVKTDGSEKAGQS